MSGSTTHLGLSGRHSINKLARREGVAAATVWRWITRGVRGHKLLSVRVGGRRYIRDCDWEEFHATMNEDLDKSRTSPANTVSAKAVKAGLALDELLGTCRRPAGA
ncbi:MAG: DUF1580 domain-containing protein [Planctomycetes bacterium]|nr:DUF1580 domain-containing protein [Planctomycetota bacterium]